MSTKIEFLWTDKQRAFGLPITFTRYSLSADRLFLEKGLLNIKQDEILLYRVKDISLKISLAQRLFGVGTITVYSTDTSLPVLIIKNVKKPRDVKELIHENVEKNKMERGMNIGEIVTNH